jgi:hypothetical protein
MPSHAPDDAADTSRITADVPLELTHAQMNAAYDSGQATPLAHAVPWLVRYQQAWWVVYEKGWLRVTDQPTADDLDQRAAQMTGEDAQAARNAAIRAAVGGTGPDEQQADT